MDYVYSFPQADNLEFVYQVFIDLDEDGLNRYTFAEKYNITDRQGAYYLNAVCFIGLAEKLGKNTFLSQRGRTIQSLDEPFRRKVFMLAILDNQFICDTFVLFKGKEKPEQKEIAEILIEGSYGIKDDATKARRARTLVSWYRWFQEQEYLIEEKHNE